MVRTEREDALVCQSRCQACPSVPGLIPFGGGGLDNILNQTNQVGWVHRT